MQPRWTDGSTAPTRKDRVPSACVFPAVGTGKVRGRFSEGELHNVGFTIHNAVKEGIMRITTHPPLSRNARALKVRELAL